MKQKAFAVGAKDAWNIQRGRIIKGLLYSGVDGMVVIFCFYQRNGDIIEI